MFQRLIITVRQVAREPPTGRTVEPFERISGDQSMTRAIAVDIGGTINGVSIAGQNA